MECHVTVASVLGDVLAEHLGPTDCHDHLFIRGGLPVVLEPDFLLDSTEAAVTEVRELQAAGGRALVDCMPLGVGRDIDRLVSVAEQTGLTIIAATGFHKDRYYAADHWVRDYGVDRITSLVVAEWTDGMERSGYNGPFVERVSARPGVIKVATSSPGPTQTERKLLVAVGAAAAATGLPVITHTDGAGCAETQLDALDREGIASNRVILSHMDRHSSLDQLAGICATGATVCLDWLGRTDRRPDEVVADLAAGLVERGYGHRIVIGQDLARRQYWHAYGGGPGLAHLFTTFVPLLGQAGLSEHDIDTMLVHTPRRVLRRREKGNR
jgi:predicted metal-dependent phosphotriesterase family hydrolase